MKFSNSETYVSVAAVAVGLQVLDVKKKQEVPNEYDTAPLGLVIQATQQSYGVLVKVWKLPEELPDSTSKGLVSSRAIQMCLGGRGMNI